MAHVLRCSGPDPLTEAMPRELGGGEVSDNILRDHEVPIDPPCRTSTSRAAVPES